jgi:hypothetical protein
VPSCDGGCHDCGKTTAFGATPAKSANEQICDAASLTPKHRRGRHEFLILSQLTHNRTGDDGFIGMRTVPHRRICGLHQGAFEAMWTGEVDLNWAKEHHDLWLEDELAKGRRALPPQLPSATPAE